MTDSSFRRTKEDSSHRHASVVRLTMDDPVNQGEAGDVFVVAGECEDGVVRTVYYAGEFLDIEGEVLETFEAQTEMSAAEIKIWGAQKAEEAGVPE